MFDHAHYIDRIERSIDADPFCPVCHARTTIRERDGGLWLECSSTPEDAPAGLRERLQAVLMPHPRRLIVDSAEGLAA
jgi:ribosomal protein L37AE/L43A